MKGTKNQVSQIVKKCLLWLPTPKKFVCARMSKHPERRLNEIIPAHSNRDLTRDEQLLA